MWFFLTGTSTAMTYFFNATAGTARPEWESFFRTTHMKMSSSALLTVALCASAHEVRMAGVATLPMPPSAPLKWLNTNNTKSIIFAESDEGAGEELSNDPPTTTAAAMTSREAPSSSVSLLELLEERIVFYEGWKKVFYEGKWSTPGAERLVRVEYADSKLTEIYEGEQNMERLVRVEYADNKST